MCFVICKVVEVAMGQDLNMYVATSAMMWKVSMSAGHGVMILQCLSNAQVRKNAELKSLKIETTQFRIELSIWTYCYLLGIYRTAVEAAATSPAPFMTRREAMKHCDQCRSESQKHILENIYLHRCHSLCIDDAECKGIEYWEGYKNRQEYKDPQKHTFDTNHAGVGFPSSVYTIKGMN